MENNEIIEALENEIHLTEYVDSDYCSNIEVSLLKSTLDLINRLQAQNKDLSETVHNLTLEKDALFDKAEELKAEVERLNKVYQANQQLINALNKSYFLAKSEAVKEFAERLKHSFFDNGYESPDIDFDYFVDNLLKEMVGEDK